MLLKKIRKFIIPIVLGFSIGLGTNLVACMVKVDGISMEPTYKDKDKLVVRRLGRPSKGDIVVFKRGSKYLIKRVIATPGDSISIEDNKVYVNNKLIYEDYIKGNTEASLSTKLKESEYFIMGDNRENSLDSRVFGSILGEDIIGIKLLDFN